VAFIPSRAEYLLREATVRLLKGPHAGWRVGLVWDARQPKPVTERFVASVREALSKR
jgi:hypothetical protein